MPLEPPGKAHLPSTSFYFFILSPLLFSVIFYHWKAAYTSMVLANPCGEGTPGLTLDESLWPCWPCVSRLILKSRQSLQLLQLTPRLGHHGPL